jgi:hypothetical protein
MVEKNLIGEESYHKKIEKMYLLIIIYFLNNIKKSLKMFDTIQNNTVKETKDINITKINNGKFGMIKLNKSNSIKYKNILCMGNQHQNE